MTKFLIQPAGFVLIALWILSVLVPLSTNAQDDELTNSELNTQKLFIEANQEKLLGAYEEAASLYMEVLETDPGNDAAQYELARVYEAMHQNDRALEFIEKAIKNSPGNEWYYVMKGDILEGLEEYAAAVDVYEYLTKLKPQEVYYYQHLVELLHRTNQPTRALAALDKYESVAGVLPELIYQKVDLYNILEKPAQAVVELEKLIRVYPYDISHLHRLAQQCKLAGDEVKARQYYQKILEIAPDDAKANLAFAEGHRAAGDDLTYLKSIAPLLTNTSVALDAKILELLPYVQKYAADRKVNFGAELGSILQNLVALYPNEAKAHAIYADYLASSGEIRQARTEYEKTLALDKSVYVVWEQLIYLKLEQKDIDGVLRTAEEALDYFPNQANLYYLRGVAFGSRHEISKASESLQQALIMSGRNTDLQFRTLTLLAEIYRDAGEKEKAFDAYARAVKLKPNDAQTLNKYAYLLVSEQGSLTLAQEMAQKALAAAPNHPDIEHTLAWIAFKLGDVKSARTFIEQSMDHGGGDRYIVLEHYGDILMTQGETESAIEHWQLSLESGNPSEILKRKIAERRIIH